MPKLVLDPALTPIERIDRICDAFDQAWRDGQQPELREYLELAPAHEQAALFRELLLAEREMRSAAGETIAWDEFLRRFPAYVGAIEALRISHVGAERPSDEHEADAPADGRLGRFELRELLGSGGAGHVWKAWDTRLQRAVAIKRPHARHMSEEALDRFLREAWAAARLQHDNIVSIYQVERESHTPYIVSRFVDGVDLGAWAAEHRPKPRQAAEMCRTLALAVEHAHQHGVIHRDLKPRNVLVDRGGVPYITDFGLAKLTLGTPDLTMHGELVGTPSYMSPEQARGEGRNSDERTDVYGLGVILYELLTRRPPFEGDRLSVLRRVVDEEPTPPRAIESLVPRDLETICLKAMSKDSQRRYASAAEMADDLDRFLEHLPIKARRVHALEKSWRWIKRRPLVAAVLLVSLVALGLVAFAGKLTRDKYLLQGYREVRLTTDPPGARVAFAQLRDSDNEPDASQVIRPRQRTPCTVWLKPGDYLVVVKLDDGRFHEVYRHVPAKEEQVSVTVTVQKSNVDAAGRVEFKNVKIPRLDVTDGMAYVMSQDLATAAELKQHQTGGIYVDCDEFSQDAYWSGYDTEIRLPHVVEGTRSVVGGYSDAQVWAEELGKRLPSEVEYECIAEYVLASRLPTDRTLNSSRTAASEVSNAANRIINDLFYGLPEWTTTRDLIGSPDLPNGGQMNRVARGGVHSNSRLIEDHAKSARAVLSPTSSAGLRLVRSVKPRFLDKRD